MIPTGYCSLDLTSIRRIRFSLSALFCIAAILALGFALQVGVFQRTRAVFAIVVSVVFCCFSITAMRASLVLPDVRRDIARRYFILLLIAFTFFSIVLLRHRHDQIDVIEFQVESVQALLHGTNPYATDVTHQDLCYQHEELCHGMQFYGPSISTNGRVHVGFPYPPLALIWVIPGYWLGDIRYSWLLAIDLAAFLIFCTSPNLIGGIAATLLLIGSGSTYVLSHGYTDPLILLGLAFTVLVAQKSPRVLPFVLGLFLASKQYSILALPLGALLLPRFSWSAYLSIVAKACAVVAIVTIPFLILDPRGFWWSLVSFQVLAPIRPDALSFSGLLIAHGFRGIPQWLVGLVTVTGIGFALWKAPRTPSAFAISLALVSILFFVLNKQAFVNYYFFCFGTLCVGLASSTHDFSREFAFVPVLSASSSLPPPTSAL